MAATITTVPATVRWMLVTRPEAETPRWLCCALPGRCRLGSGVLVALAVMSWSGVSGANWEVTPRISVSVEATDNVTLAPRGEEESDLIGTLNPGISFRHEGPRSDTRIGYQLNARVHADETREDRITHSLRASNDLEIVREAFFLETRATRTEQATSLLAPGGLGGSTPRDNLQETTRYSISPVLRTRYGSFANQELRYTFDEIRNHRSDRSDSQGQRVDYTLDSGAAFNRPFWQLSASYQEERFDDGPTGEFGEVGATAGYRFGRSLRVFGTAGQEFNDFATTRREDDDTFWEVGVGWAPTRLTSIEARYGERFFGENRSLSVNHRSRRATYRLSYSEGISSTRRRGGSDFLGLAEQLGLTVEELFDQFTLDEVNQLLSDRGFDEALTEGFFLTRNWRGSWAYDTGRSRFGVNVFHTRRSSETRTGTGLFEDNNQRTGINASWQWEYSPRTTTELRTGFTEVEFQGDERKDEQTFIRASMSRSLGQDTSVRLSYRYQRRDSDEAANEYQENSVIGTLTRTF